MVERLDPVVVKELRESKAALARHGIVILRTVERELEPAIMVAVRDSVASSPRRLGEMEDKELDSFLTKARKAAMKSCKELSELHTHLLGKLGIEYIADLVKELDGIGQLFKWERISKTVDSVNRLLEKEGFQPITLAGPAVVSEAFAVELEEKWPAAFRRFKDLAERVAEDLIRSGGLKESTPPEKRKSGKSPRKKSTAKKR